MEKGIIAPCIMFLQLSRITAFTRNQNQNDIISIKADSEPTRSIGYFRKGHNSKVAHQTCSLREANCNNKITN